MAIIMAVLIVAALAVIIVTIYSRLTAANSAKEIQQNELVIPADSLITGASLGAKGKMLVIIEIRPASNYGNSMHWVKFSAKSASRHSGKICQSRIWLPKGPNPIWPIKAAALAAYRQSSTRHILPIAVKHNNEL